MEKLSERIRHLMQTRGLNQAQFARDIGVSHQAVRLWLQDKGQISRRVSQIVAERCGVSALWVRDGEGPMRKEAGNERSTNEPAVLSPPQQEPEAGDDMPKTMMDNVSLRGWRKEMGRTLVKIILAMPTEALVKMPPEDLKMALEMILGLFRNEQQGPPKPPRP